jgi:hypothetical protein
MPEHADKKKKWVKDLLGEFLNLIKPNAASHVVFAIIGSNKSRPIPIEEVKIDN